MNTEIVNKFNEFISQIKSTPNVYNPDSYLDFSKYYLTNFAYQTLDFVDKITDIDFEIYVLDAVTNEKVIYETLDYSLFSVNNRILIAFHDYKKFTPKTYVYAEHNGSTELIQIYNFENAQKFFRSGKDHSWGSFVFMDSKIINKRDFPENSLRCDVNDYGPKYWADDGNSNDITDSNAFKDKKVSINEIEEFSVIMSVPKFGHITYLRVKPIDGKILSDDYNNDAIVPAVTRTIFELIKLIDEWASVSEEPFNNTQEISVKAKNFISGLDIPENIHESIKTLQTDMQVYRYLSGLENARQRPPLDEIATIPDSVYDWFKGKFCYERFQNMIDYHPAFYEKI